MVKIWFADLEPVPTLFDTTLRGALRRFLRVEEGRAGQTALSHLCQVQTFCLLKEKVLSNGSWGGSKLVSIDPLFDVLSCRKVSFTLPQGTP